MAWYLYKQRGKAVVERFLALFVLAIILDLSKVNNPELTGRRMFH
jgi:hypothetical protein